MIPYFQGLNFLSDSDYRGCYWRSQKWSMGKNLLHPLITVFTELFTETKKPDVRSCGRNSYTPSPTSPSLFSSPLLFPSLSLPQFKFCDTWDQAQGFVFAIQVLYLWVTPQPCSSFSLLLLLLLLLLEHMLQIQILISSQNAIQMDVGVVSMSISTIFGFQSIYHVHKLEYWCKFSECKSIYYWGM